MRRLVSPRNGAMAGRLGMVGTRNGSALFCLAAHNIYVSSGFIVYEQPASRSLPKGENDVWFAVTTPTKRKTCWAHVESQKCATKPSISVLMIYFYYNTKFITFQFLMLQTPDVIIGYCKDIYIAIYVSGYCNYMKSPVHACPPILK